jgi:four helix bundle protein
MTPSPKSRSTSATTSTSSLPHHRLVAYGVAFELATLIGGLRISDARLREQARKSAASCALNIAEGAGRRSRADKSRVYAIALAECCEAASAVEIAGALRACRASDVEAVIALASRVAQIVSRLIQ